MDKFLIERESDVVNVLQTWGYQNIAPTLDKVHEFEAIKDIIDTYRGQVLKYKNPPVKWDAMFETLAVLLLSLLKGELGFDIVSFTSLLLSKHRVYTAAPLRRWREVGVLMRIDSKFERAYQIFHNPAINPEEHKESLEQNLLDTVGYCVLGFLLSKEKTNEHR